MFRQLFIYVYVQQHSTICVKCFNMNKHTINTNETASVETREGSNIYIQWKRKRNENKRRYGCVRDGKRRENIWNSYSKHVYLWVVVVCRQVIRAYQTEIYIFQSQFEAKTVNTLTFNTKQNITKQKKYTRSSNRSELNKLINALKIEY